MKKTLRQEYLEKRNNLDKNYIKDKSIKIWNNIFQTDEYKLCKNIFIFLSINSELDTYSFIEKAFDDGKNVCVPVLSGEKSSMYFCQIKNFLNLKPNKFGILEPVLRNIVKCNNETMIIVPGLVYSKEKYRIGYGGGFYDKFLNENKPLISIGVCLDEFILDKIEIEKHDKSVDIVFTDKRTLK